MKKLSYFDIERIRIKNIAFEIIHRKTVYETIKGEKYGFLTDKGIVYVKIMETSEVINSRMFYDAVKGNEFNIGLYLAKIVKIAMGQIKSGKKQIITIGEKQQ